MVLNKLRDKIISREAVAGVCGLGYVGLPLAMAYVRAGYQVLGYDIDEEKIKAITAGESYVGDVAADDLSAAVAGGRLVATAAPSRLGEADVLAVCVPTPLTAEKEPDLSYLLETIRTVAAHMRPGQLIIIESTVFPGATRGSVLPLLEGRGLKVGSDFALAYSPERVDPGNKEYPLDKIPTVVGGVDDLSAALATLFYEPVVSDVKVVSSAEVAETSKLLENVYRAVNIALVNELKQMCHKMGLDVFEVIEAAATKPYGFQPFMPGPGVGGHCIPLDPYYLSWRGRQFGHGSRFVELAGEVNDEMPAYVVGRLREALAARGKELAGAAVLVVGVAYKPDVDDLRESPALEIIGLLREAGAAVAYHDPYAPTLPRTRKFDFGLSSAPVTAGALETYDAVIIATDHAGVDYEVIFDSCELVVDTRGVARRLGRAGDNVVAA